MPSGIPSPRISAVQGPAPFNAAVLQALDTLRMSLIEEQRAEREVVRWRRLHRDTERERWRKIAERAVAATNKAREELDELLTEDA